jgi:hypothetical protein
MCGHQKDLLGTAKNAVRCLNSNPILQSEIWHKTSHKSQLVLKEYGISYQQKQLLFLLV